MGGVTPTLFGLSIAYLLPGMVALASLAFWLPELRSLTQSLVESTSTAAMLVSVLAISLTLGLILSLLRWFLFDILLARPYQWVSNRDLSIPLHMDKAMTDPDVLEAFRSTIDENFRHHQFLGAFSIVFPLFCFGWFLQYGPPGITGCPIAFWAIFLAGQLLAIIGSFEALNRYAARGRAILDGGTHEPPQGKEVQQEVDQEDRQENRQENRKEEHKEIEKESREEGDKESPKVAPAGTPTTP